MLTGGLRDFARRGIVYDREGSLEVRAGATVSNSPRLRSGLGSVYAARMVPDIVVNPDVGPMGCQTNPNPHKFCLPVRPTDIAAYTLSFIQTARSVLQSHPGKLVLFEPMNEPWTWASPPGTPSSRAAATEYAKILIRLLPAARAAGIPLNDIYVPAVGVLSDGTSWIPDLYSAQPCLRPGPASCGPVAGWNLHPYGLPHSGEEGIGSVPGIRAQMASGGRNVVVSEIGFCATDVSGGKNCDVNREDLHGTSSQAAQWLTSTLKQAAVMHRAGWLKALMLWERAGSGWAMQNVDGTLTAQGRAVDLFAATPAGR